MAKERWGPTEEELIENPMLALRVEDEDVILEVEETNTRWVFSPSMAAELGIALAKSAHAADPDVFERFNADQSWVQRLRSWVLKS